MRNQSFAFLIVLLITCFLHAGEPLFANEFLRTGRGVYQLTNLREKVIVVDHGDNTGVFVVSGPEKDLQLWNPAQIQEKDSLHVFISFKPSENRYDSLVIGENRYSIKGSFTLNLHFLRITVDAENPYMSIVYDNVLDKGAEPAIMVIRGLQVLETRKGHIAVALLEANQFNNKYRGLIEPYYLKKLNGEPKLLVKGASVTGTIGLALRTPYPCRKAILLSKLDVEKVKNAKSEAERRRIFNGVLKQTKNEGRYKDMLILRSDEDAAIGYKDGEIFIIRPVAGKADGAVRSCMVESVNLSS